MRRAPILSLALLVVGCGARSELFAEGADASPKPTVDAGFNLNPATDGSTTASDSSVSGCLERPAVDCSCAACDQGVVLGAAIANLVARCPLPCSLNVFWFDSNGCVTEYTPPSGEDDCVQQLLSTVRFPCAVDVVEPLVVYNLGGRCGQ